MLNLIASPTNIDKNAESFTKKIVKFLKAEGKEYSAYFSQTMDAFKQNVVDLTNMNETEFVLIGGDYALNVFLNSCKDIAKIKLGIVPTSAHDDFAKYLHLNTNPIDAIKEILTGEIHPIDYLIANETVVANNILIGASAEIASAYDNSNVNPLTKKINEWRFAPQYEGVQLQLDFKTGKPKRENVFELSVANGGLAKGKQISPLANVKDGLFNLNYVATLGEKERKKYYGEYSSGKQTYNEKTKQHWLKSVQITGTEGPFKAVLDGQVKTFESVNIILVENGLKLFKTAK